MTPRATRNSTRLSNSSNGREAQAANPPSPKSVMKKRGKKRKQPSDDDESPTPSGQNLLRGQNEHAESSATQPRPPNLTQVDSSNPILQVNGTEILDIDLNENFGDRDRTPVDLSTPPIAIDRLEKSELASNGPLNPHVIDCAVNISFFGNEDGFIPTSSTKEEEKLFWHFPESFSMITKRARRLSKTLVPDGESDVNDSTKHHVYLRQGAVRVCGRVNRLRFQRFEVEDDFMEKATQSICVFIAKHRYEPMNLEIFLDYSLARIKPPGKGDTFRELIRTELEAKTKENFYRDKYISNVDVAPFLTLPVIQGCVNEDTTLDLTSQEQKNTLAQDILLKSRYCHAICILSGIELRWLKHWIDLGLNDDRAKNNKLERIHPNGDPLCHFAEECRTKFKEFDTQHWKFFAHTFPPPLNAAEPFLPQHEVFTASQPKVVIPLHYVKGEDNDWTLGKGHSSTVYRVKIDPLHHHFDTEPKDLFALKECSNNPIDGENEVAVLNRFQETANRSISIVQHYASWVHRDNFYILLPLAKYNLADYMNARRLDHSKANILWFLGCLGSLTDGLTQMHRGNDSTTPNSNKSLNPSSLLPGYATYHFDIKPENLLLFDTGNPEGLELRISDFGSSHFCRLLRGNKSVPMKPSLGSIRYQGPEIVAENPKISRPYDVWAVGCVILEFLLWFAHPKLPVGEDCRDTFARLRVDENVEHGDETDRFWVKTGEPDILRSCELNRAVRDKFDELSALHPDKLLFKDVIEVVKKILVIEPRRRLDAAQLHDQIERVRERTVEQLNEPTPPFGRPIDILSHPISRPTVGLDARTPLTSGSGRNFLETATPDQNQRPIVTNQEANFVGAWTMT